MWSVGKSCNIINLINQIFKINVYANVEVSNIISWESKIYNDGCIKLQLNIPNYVCLLTNYTRLIPLFACGD